MIITSPATPSLSSHWQSLMIYRPYAIVSHFDESHPEGLTFDAFYIDTRSGDVLRRVTCHIPQDVRIHFVASSLPGWYFIVEFSAYYQRYCCSCPQGRCYQTTQQPCQHVLLLHAEMSDVA